MVCDKASQVSGMVWHVVCDGMLNGMEVPFIQGGTFHRWGNSLHVHVPFTSEDPMKTACSQLQVSFAHAARSHV